MAVDQREKPARAVVGGLRFRYARPSSGRFSINHCMRRLKPGKFVDHSGREFPRRRAGSARPSSGLSAASVRPFGRMKHVVEKSIFGDPTIRYSRRRDCSSRRRCRRNARKTCWRRLRRRSCLWRVPRRSPACSDNTCPSSWCRRTARCEPPVGSGALRSKTPMLSRPRNPPWKTLRPSVSLRLTHQVKLSSSF